MALCALAIPNSQVCSLYYVYVNDVCLCILHYEHLSQLAGVYLGNNQLEGTLPESWSECINVSHCFDRVYWLIAVAAVVQLAKNICKDAHSHQPRALRHVFTVQLPG